MLLYQSRKKNSVWISECAFWNRFDQWNSGNAPRLYDDKSQFYSNQSYGRTHIREQILHNEEIVVATSNVRISKGVS